MLRQPAHICACSAAASRARTSSRRRLFQAVVTRHGGVCCREAGAPDCLEDASVSNRTAVLPLSALWLEFLQLAVIIGLSFKRSIYEHRVCHSTCLLQMGGFRRQTVAILFQHFPVAEELHRLLTGPASACCVTSSSCFRHVVCSHPTQLQCCWEIHACLCSSHTACCIKSNA